jgi:RNA polymerase sigma-70 factor, ECF subfamily
MPANASTLDHVRRGFVPWVARECGKRSMPDLRGQLADEIPRLRRFARALTRDRETADDLVQDTLVRALRAETRWAGTNLRIWLFTILANLNRNRLRGMARRAPHSQLDEADDAHAVPASTGEAHDLMRALDSLSAEHREVLVLVGVEGFTYDECAQALSIPAGTVMSRLFRARALLRERLNGGDAPNQPHLRVIK